MANVANRITAQYLTSVHTPSYPVEDWVINPDVSLLLGIVPNKYWKVVGDDVLEMTQSEKDVVDEELRDTDLGNIADQSGVIITTDDTWTTMILSDMKPGDRKHFEFIIVSIRTDDEGYGVYKGTIGYGAETTIADYDATVIYVLSLGGNGLDRRIVNSLSQIGIQVKGVIGQTWEHTIRRAII